MTLTTDLVNTARKDKAQFSEDFIFNVMQGLVPNHSIIHKFGARSAIDTTLTVVSSAGTYRTPSALTSLELVSSDNTNDKAGQAGLQKVRITGLGTGWTEISEDVTLNGTTAVALVNQYYRVYSMYGIQSGSYASTAATSHNSTITLRETGAGQTWATIIPEGTFGLGRALIGAYTVPKGKTAYILSDHASVEAQKIAKLFRFTRDNCDDTAAPYTGFMLVNDIIRAAEGETGHSDLHAGPFVGPCDIGYMAAATANTANVEVDFCLLVVNS